jgi:hypothetical protein
MRCNGAIQAIPSVARFMSIEGVDENMAKGIMLLINDRIDIDVFPQYEDLARKMHGPPSKIAVIDKILDMHGVETVAVGEEGDFDGPYFAYCNAGDMYVTTVVEFEGNFYLGSYEDCRKSAASVTGG